jgi:hypothetical protein
MSRRIIVRENTQSINVNVNALTAAIPASRVNAVTERYSIPVKMHKGSMTRATAANIAAMHLIEKIGTAPVELIDDVAFNTWGFPISHRKYSPTKNKGGLAAVKRVQRYIAGDEKHNAHSDVVASFVNVSPDGTVFPIDVLATQLDAERTRRERASLVRKAKERSIALRSTLKGKQTRKHNADIKRATDHLSLHLGAE